MTWPARARHGVIACAILVPTMTAIACLGDGPAFRVDAALAASGAALLGASALATRGKGDADLLRERANPTIARTGAPLVLLGAGMLLMAIGTNVALLFAMPFAFFHGPRSHRDAVKQARDGIGVGRNSAPLHLGGEAHRRARGGG